MKPWKRNVALFLVGQSITLFGSMLVHFAVMWHITLQTQSGVMMTLISIAGALPMVLISPFAGVWADRYNKKHIINIADAAIAIITLALAIIFSLGFEHVALLLVCMVVRAFGQGVQFPTVNSLVPEIVPQKSLTRINGISSGMQSVIMLAAPAAGAVLISMAPLQAILYIDVVTAAIGIGILLFFVKTPPPKRTSERKSSFEEMKDGLKYLKTHAFVKQVTLAGLLFNLLLGPAAILTLLQVVRKFGEEPWRLAAIELAFFIGMTLGGLLIGTWGGFKNKIHTSTLGVVLNGVFIIGMGLLGNFWLYLGCMFLAGMSVPIFNAPLMALLQSKVKPDFMGRVLSVMTMISAVAMPIGMLVWGPLADKVSIDILLIVSGSGVFGIAAIFTFSKTLQEVDEQLTIDEH